MTDKQKDLAIYQAMCEIATNYFNRVVRECESFREFMSEKSIISLKEIKKCTIWIIATGNVEGEKKTIEVDTFSCSYKEDDFGMLSYFKSLANVKQELYFTYEEEIKNEFVGTVEVQFENPTTAKKLISHTCDDELRKILNYVLVDIDAKSGDINFVASNQSSIGIISSNPNGVYKTPATEGSFQAIFSADDWKLICDYAKKSKSPVEFEIYRRKLSYDKNSLGKEEAQDTMIAVIGDKRIRSTIESRRYPNWRNAIGCNGFIDKSKMKIFRMHQDDINDMHYWLQKMKPELNHIIYISFYRGSDIVYFDRFFEDGKCMTQTFRLSDKSEYTIGFATRCKNLIKTKPTGFRIIDHESVIFIEDQITDITINMPALTLNDCVFDIEQREVIVDEMQMAEVSAELVA